MRVKAEIVNDYINGENISKYNEEWFFKYDGHTFEEPSYEFEHRKSVERIFQQIKSGLEDFIPCNIEVWDTLFTNWREITDKVTINLIVGYPEPFDASVFRGPDGENTVILDLGIWTKYEGKCEMTSVVHNLLTHELCHVCIGKIIKDIDNDINSDDYFTNLDANTFHEAFAHLISFEDKEINEVQWYSGDWQDVKEKCRKTMIEALVETNINKQREFLQNAIYGNYKEKYAAVSGMFYLVDCWINKGVAGLKEEFKNGYCGFAQKTAKGYSNK